MDFELSINGGRQTATLLHPSSISLFCVPRTSKLATAAFCGIDEWMNLKESKLLHIPVHYIQPTSSHCTYEHCIHQIHILINSLYSILLESCNKCMHLYNLYFNLEHPINLAETHPMKIENKKDCIEVTIRHNAAQARHGQWLSPLVHCSNKILGNVFNLHTYQQLLTCASSLICGIGWNILARYRSNWKITTKK